MWIEIVICMYCEESSNGIGLQLNWLAEKIIGEVDLKKRVVKWIWNRFVYAKLAFCVCHHHSSSH